MEYGQPTLSPAGLESTRRALVIGVVTVAALAGLGYWRSAEVLRGSQGALRAGAARLTLAQDDGRRSLAKVGRRREPELWYRVTLEEAALGAPQRLRCEWTDPTGRVMHENRYETKPIDHLPWETHARL